MSMDMDFARQIADGLNEHLADAVDTEPQYVKLGLGSGYGVVFKDLSKRIAYTFEGTLGGTVYGQGAAYVPAGKGIDLRNGKDQEGLDIEIRLRSGSTTDWVITEVRKNALDGTDGRLPTEQKADRAAHPTLSQIDVLRPSPAGGLSFIAPGEFPYIKPSTGERRVVYNASGSVAAQVAALSLGQHQAATLYFDTEAGVMSVATATAVTASATPPSQSSRGEFYNYSFLSIAIPPEGIPVANVYLYYGQTTLAEADFYRAYDPRPLFQPTTQLWASIATSDATVTALLSIAVAEASAITITGTVIGTNSDYSASIGGTFTATARRATGDDVALVGTPTITTDHDSLTGTPAVTIAEDTGTQSLIVYVQGIAAEGWVWRISATEVKAA